ncbi:MAG: M15 family metallopeptidase [Marmoricola sp.]
MRLPLARTALPALLLLGTTVACGAAPADVSAVPTAVGSPRLDKLVVRGKAQRLDKLDVQGKVDVEGPAHSTADPRSIWVVVNKTHEINPTSYRPEISIVRGYQVATVAAGALSDLLDASDQVNLGFKIASAFRSFDYQRSVHDALVGSEGQVAADKVSARPGFSEHQTGLAADLITPDDPSCDFKQCFGQTAGGRWLTQHAWEFGFLVRYTAGNEAITGYSPEPWHLRYVGKPLATAMHDDGVTTLEEMLDVPGGGYR